jgi:MscS family membrane protein
MIRTPVWGRAGLRGALVLIALAYTAPGLPVAAQDSAPAATPAATATPAGPADDFGRGVPRSAARGYLEACWAGAYERAAAYLDLRRVSKGVQKTDGPRLARQLCSVIDRTIWVDPELLSDAPEGERDDGLPVRQELVGTIQTARAPVQVLLERVLRDDGTLVWRISSTTVAKIPGLYEEFGYGPWGDLLPAPLFESRFLQIQLWQWIALLLLIAAAYLLSWLITRALVRIGRVLVARSHTTLDDKVLGAAVGPVRLTTAVLLFYAGALGLALSVRAQAVTAGLGQILGIAAATWLLIRLGDALTQVIEERLLARNHVAVSFVPLGRKTLKVFIVAMGVLAALQNVGFNVTSLLAGLGIGGLAVALAAQKTVEHLFGSVTLVADQPVRVGDFCRFGNTLGTVEDIGLRSTRLRTVDRTLISIPNAEFAAMQIENFSKRDRTGLRVMIGVRYETTPDQLRYLLVELKRMLLAHPKVHPDPARVRFVAFGSSSLDVEIFAHILTANHDEFLAIREDILLRVMDIVRASGTGFAFPSQTIYAGTDSGADDAKRRAAEGQVEAWRAANALCLPAFPADQVAALHGTIDYPPKGAAVRG